jgi:hypothetical protein
MLRLLMGRPLLTQTSFWRLGCFTLHRYFSSFEAQDGLYHQRQAILRNSDTAQDGAWRLLMSMFAWRSGARARKPILRLLPTIILAFSISAVFGVASIFSSNVTSETLNQVLLKGTRCGSTDKDKGTVYKQLTLLLPDHAERATKFLNYGMQCYTNETHIDGCNTYIKPRLPLVSTRGIPCPFGDNICKLDNDNLMMDTGILDSLEDLGINTGPKDRFQFRMVHQCAPLKTQGYMRDFNDSDYGAVKRYMYGKVATVKGGINFTFEVPLNNAYLPNNDGSSSANIPRLDYQLGVQQHYATSDEALFPGINAYFPIPALRLADADVTLAFLSAPEIHFSNPVNDSWISARKNASEIRERETKDKFISYVQDEPLGVMACTQQIQYCNPNLPEAERCEPLRGFIDPRRNPRVHKIFPEESHFATIKWVDNLWTYGIYSISSTLGFIGASALRARFSLSYGYSGPLPDNQWQLEAEHWVKGTLASFQDVFVTAANGIPKSLEDFRQPPLANETVAQNLCVNQKIVSTSYSSFNVLGVSLILILGVIVIVLDMSLEPTIAWFQHRRYARLRVRDESFTHDEKTPHPLYGAIEWSQTSTLQLQRLAYEEAGWGEWSKCGNDVPVTAPGQLIAGFDLHNIAHPQLKQQRATPMSEWSEVASFKPRGVRRSDTGLETLVEEAAAAKEGEKEDMEVEEVPMTFHAIGERIAEREHGLGMQLNDRAIHEDQTQAWKNLR